MSLTGAGVRAAVGRRGRLGRHTESASVRMHPPGAAARGSAPAASRPQPWAPACLLLADQAGATAEAGAAGRGSTMSTSGSAHAKQALLTECHVV